MSDETTYRSTEINSAGILSAYGDCELLLRGEIGQGDCRLRLWQCPSGVLVIQSSGDICWEGEIGFEEARERITSPDALAIGRSIGAAIAHDVLAEGMAGAWEGLSIQDGDRLLAAGIKFGTPGWDAAEAAAEIAYRDALKLAPGYESWSNSSKKMALDFIP